jgi:hypothetical protein
MSVIIMATRSSTKLNPSCLVSARMLIFATPGNLTTRLRGQPLAFGI